MQSLEFIRTWRGRIKTWQEKVPAVASLPSEEERRSLIQEGAPVVMAVSPIIPPTLFAQALADVAGLLSRPEVQSIAAAALSATPGEQQQLAEAALNGDGEVMERWATDKGIDVSHLAMLAGLALQPFLGRFAQQVNEPELIALWRQTYCPTCGREADVTRIDPDNLRFLHCPQCDTQWQHHRLACARCETDDIKKVNILTVEELEPWRVEVCDVCGDYCKTLDQRHGGVLAYPNVDLFLEDARTIKLDLLAQQHGYRRGGRAQ